MAEQTPAKTTEKAAKKPAEKASGKSNVIVGVLAIAALGLATYSWQQSNKIHQQLQQISSANNNIQAIAQKALTTSQQQSTPDDSQYQELKGQQAELARALDAAVAKVDKASQQSTASDDRWVMQESEYLIHLAELNLKFNQNVSAAIHLLEAADRQLKSVGQKNIVNARKAIAADLLKLKAIPVVDKAGLLSRLDALSQQAKQLPLRTPKTPKEVEADQNQQATETPKPKSRWKKGLDNALGALQKIVVIRHQQQPMQALMGPEQQQLLLHTIAYQLQQAQWALLNNQEAIYKTSLQQVQTTVTDNYAQDKQSTKAFLSELQKLQAIQLQTSLPNLDKSLKAIGESIKGDQA